jgi:hypothetical protein
MVEKKAQIKKKSFEEDSYLTLVTPVGMMPEGIRVRVIQGKIHGSSPIEGDRGLTPCRKTVKQETRQ